MNQPDGGPAFPTHPDSPASPAGYLGMSLRDWFAGMVLQGMLAGEMTSAKHAEQAYAFADAMLTQRERP